MHLHSADRAELFTQPLLTPEEIVLLIEQADALRQARMHGREVFLRHPGDARSAHLGRGLDFEEVRAYQAGDDIRAMDWRTTARTGKPYLKIYRPLSMHLHVLKLQKEFLHSCWRANTHPFYWI